MFMCLSAPIKLEKGGVSEFDNFVLLCVQNNVSYGSIVEVSAANKTTLTKHIIFVHHLYLFLYYLIYLFLYLYSYIFIMPPLKKWAYCF